MDRTTLKRQVQIDAGGLNAEARLADNCSTYSLDKTLSVEIHKADPRKIIRCGFEMVLVRVQRIESIRDPEGVLGKRIELVEERKIPRFAIRPSTEEARMVQSVVQALQQQLPVQTIKTGFNLPKIILFLSEQEYDTLGIKFDVNQVYEVEMKSQSITLKKAP